MNVIAEIQRINQAELENGSVGTSASWHAKYADSAWVYAGNIPIQLTEGDIICVMSQFGEVSTFRVLLFALLGCDVWRFVCFFAVIITCSDTHSKSTRDVCFTPSIICVHCYC